MNELSVTERPADILIVDDTPANLQVLAGMLKERGYKVRPVPSGRLALRAAESEPPDLILLDIMMPDMEGYEVCRRLKQNRVLQDIPVIFVSALNETMDKVKAFGVGGVDYVTKPFQFEEVQARVETHLRLRRLQLELEARYRQLQDNYQRLRELESLRDSLTHMIVHDLRTPLGAILTSLETIADLGELNELQQELLTMSIQSGQSLLGMINDLLDVGKLEEGSLRLEREVLHPADLARQAAQQVSALARRSGLDLQVKVEDDLPVLLADRDLLQRTLVNLLGNAIKFTAQGSVTLAVHRERSANAVRFSVTDTGLGIPHEAFDRIFEKFGQVDARTGDRRMSTGLGLTFCKMVVEAHGGRIWVESEVGQGSTFSFTISLPDDV